MEEVVQVSGLSKSFSSTGQHSPFWALRDINFNLQQGDLLAIIGKNGSGKSTLLKILSEIYKPTTGTAVIKGRVASVLDIGTGFHPDLTGRENIAFYGALTGFGRNELKAKFDEIVDFSGLAAFIDTPLRNYSNGMFVRLAVSVILCLHYDLLILDEVVGAGDSEFKFKMADRMKRITDEGTTILMASHNINELFNCNAVLWLQAGNMKKFCYDKNTLVEYMEETIGAYKLTVANKENSGQANVVETGITYGGFKLNELWFSNKDQTPSSVFSYDDDIYMQVKATVLESGAKFPFQFGIFDSLSNLLFGTSYQVYNPDFKANKEGDEIRFTAVFPKSFFNLGSYSINLYGLHGDGRFKDLGKNVASFTIIAVEKASFAPRGSFMPGIIRPFVNWHINMQNPPV